MNKMLKKGMAVITAIIMLAVVAVNVYAHEGVDMGRKGAVQIEMRYNQQSVPGGELVIYRVGDVVENNGDYSFAWKPELNCTADVKDVLSEKTAGEVWTCVNATNVIGTPQTIGQDGKASFGDLEVGLYLIAQSKAADKYKAIKPFLIAVPQWDEEAEQYNYNVSGNSKVELLREDDPPVPPTTEAPPVTETPPTKPKLPQTGQLNWPVPILLGIGVVLCLAGIALKKKKHNA